MRIIKLFSFFVITNLIGATTFAQINHVEPLNWWVGMKNPNLQLMINGNAIGETTPFINYPGVLIKKSTKGDSKNYLFLDLIIAKNTKPGNLLINFKKQGKTVYTYTYSLLQREKNAAQLKGFDASDVIYLIVPDRFANGDYTNDIVAGMKENKIDRNFDGGRHGGDIRGIINSLDYIANMGYTAIWPTPLLENDMPAYSYHGYAITNHYKVDPRYGTLNDYKELSMKMRKKGMKLIFDEVLNHSGSGYWWMNDLPFTNWLNYPNNYTPTNHARTINQDLYASAYDKDLMTNGWFDTTMPDMNGSNPFMSNYLIQSTIWWIETLQLGGIREDTYGYADKTFLSNWSCSIKNEYPNFTMVGEEWSVNPLITSYWQQGKQRHDGYKSCLTTIMDFPIQAALIDALTKKEENKYQDWMKQLYEGLANDFVYADPNNIMVMGDNHDMDRLFMQLNQDVDLTKMALTYLLTIRGIPQIFYGTEILMDNTGHHKVDGLIRSDFPGGWENDAINAYTGKGLTAAQLDMQAYLKQLLNWRKNNSVIAKGKTLHFVPFHGVYVYFRYNQEKMIMVVMNKNAEPVSIDTARFSEILTGKKMATDIMTNEKADLQKQLSVAGKTASIFEIK